MAGRLLCVAAAFGYGPVAKLLAVANSLSAQGYELTFLGEGTSLELARDFPFAEIFECSVGEVEGRIHSLIKGGVKVDGIVNVLEPAVGEVASQLALPHFYIDSLFWMWPTIDSRVANADVYFIQRFPGVEDRCLEWSAQISNPLLVGPIVDVYDFSGLVEGVSRLIVNFAGLESPFVGVNRGLHYPYVLASLMYPIMLRLSSSYKEIFVTGNKLVMAELDSRFMQRPANIQFAHLSHDSFLKLLGSAALLVSSPGLTTTYEAFLMKVPVRFLPPQNYSQSLMLDYYRQEKLVDFSCHWSDFYPEYNVSTGLDETIAVGKVAATIERFSIDRESQESAQRLLEHMFFEPIDSCLSRKQQEFAKSMGTQSAAYVAEVINSTLVG